MANILFIDQDRRAHLTRVCARVGVSADIATDVLIQGAPVYLAEAHRAIPELEIGSREFGSNVIFETPIQLAVALEAQLVPSLSAYIGARVNACRQHGDTCYF